jgi:hypothetical protein
MLVSLIYTPFKTGSCTLYEILATNDMSHGVWINNTTNPYAKYHFVIKAHPPGSSISEQLIYFNSIYNPRCDLVSDPMSDPISDPMSDPMSDPISDPMSDPMSDSYIVPDIIFTTIRNPLDIYKSAYFQDITCDAYDYYYGPMEVVLDEDVNKLITHFNTFKWDSYYHLSVYNTIKDLSEYTNIDILSESYDKEKGYKIYYSRRSADNKPIILCIINMELLHDRNRIAKLLEELKYPSEIINNSYIIEDSNIGSDKWYSSKYAEFKNKFGNGYNGYNGSNDNYIISDNDKLIIDKFF